MTDHECLSLVLELDKGKKKKKRILEVSLEKKSLRLDFFFPVMVIKDGEKRPGRTRVLA